MPTPVDLGDAATTLDQSRAAAEQTAKAIGGGALNAPDTTPAPPLKIGRAPQVKPAGPPGPPSADLTVPQPNDADQIPHEDFNTPPPPTPAQTKPKPGAWDQSGSELGNGIMRGFAELGRAVMFVGGGSSAAGMDAVHSLFTGEEQHGAQDALYKALDEYSNRAVNYWKPQDQEKSGLGAQVVGDAAGVIPALTTGPLALPLLTAQAGTDTGVEAVNAGQDAKTAAILATISSLANVAGMKIPLKSPNIWKRIGSSVLGNLAISKGVEGLTKEILESRGYKEAADKIDMTDPRSILSTLAIAIGFGLHRQAGADPKQANKLAQDNTKVGQPPAPDASQTAPPGPPGDENAQPPAPPSQSAAQPASMQSPAGASAPVPDAGMASEGPGNVPDTPSIESSKDLRAQIRDMNDKNTPRVGVLLAKDSLASLAGSKDANALSVNGTLNQARAQGRTIQLPQGELMLKSAKIAKATQDRLTAGEDPQTVIGSVTGAGSGKSPEQTVVVQGHTPTGEVATESMVKPDEVPMAVQKVQDQNKTPVVTTPEKAVARRIDTVSQERNSPTEMGLMMNEDGSQSAVHVEQGAPEGMIRVRHLDEEGEPTSKVLDVPKDRVKVAAATEAKAPPTDKGTEPSEPVAVKAAEPVASEETPIAETKGLPRGEGPTDQTVQTPTEDTSQKPVISEAAAEPAKPATENEGPTPKSTAENKEVPAPVSPKLKAVKIETPFEALPKALEVHEQQEEIPPGKKNATSLGERQQNASLFAHILQSAADNARGKTEPAAIERAVKASKAAIGYADKGKEATAKGQGTSHVKITALVNEMHKAARGLLGTAREGDSEIVKPKEAELKARRARDDARLVKKAKEAAKPKEAPAAEEPTKPAEPVAKKVAPEKTSEVDKQRGAQRLMSRYISADEADLPQVRTDVEQFLHEHMGDEYSPDQIKDVLNMLHEQRLEQNPEAVRHGPRNMSDTVEEETHEHETSPKALKTLGLRSGSKHMLSVMEGLKQKVFSNRMSVEWQRLATSLKKSGGLSSMVNRHLDTGRALGAHEVLDRIIADTDSPILKGVLQNLRSKVPDMPIHFVSQIQDLYTGKPFTSGASATGLFSKNLESVQVRAGIDRNTLGIARTIVHELVHAATAYEVHNNPHGKLAIALEAARKVLVGRLANKYGQDAIDQHLSYFRGESGSKAPEGYNRSLYGMTNVDEMMAELHVNPDFANEIADSENYKSSGEAQLNDTFLGGAKTLLFKMYGAIGKFLGIQDPKLLEHIAGLTDKTMEVQNSRTAPGKPFDFLNKSVHDFESELVTAMRNRFGANPMEISRALPAFREIAQEPRPVPNEREVMREIGDQETTEEVSRTTRLFRQAMNSGVVDGIRAVQTKLKTVPQIFRDNRRYFGDRNDPQNPLNRLADVNAEKTKMIHDLSEISRPVAKAWMKLNSEDNIKVGGLLRDATMYKLDPRKTLSEQTPEGKDDPKAAARHAEFEARYRALSMESREVFSSALDASRKLARAERRANIDTALESFSDSPITDAQRALLYSARSPKAFEELVGEGKLIDVGENNDKLKAALGDFAGQTELEGPYAHLGRHGEYVVSAEPEGTRRFADEASARRFADEVSNLSPNSRGTYVLRGGEHVVDYKAQYTSFHETRNDAEAALARMKEAGYKVGLVTRKTMSREDTPLSAGTRDLVAAAESRINRNGKSKGNDALIAGLRSAFLQLAAQRSAYAGSRMARKNFAGVKPEEMRRNFADHAQSVIWHTAQLRTTFKQAAALAKLRDMARDAHNENVDQQTMYRRGETVAALNSHLKDEVTNFGHKSAFNASLARLGFMSYLASPSHAYIWMTQNFTTGIPVGGARWGYGRAASSFGAAMKLLSGPALRETVHAVFSKGGSSDDVNKAIFDAVKADKRFGKWAQGPNSPMQQLIDRGVIGHSYSSELHEMAQNGKDVLGVPATAVNRAFEWARLLPNMADAWNRVSTALAALEMTGGDIRKTADFVDEIHADYSASAKPLAFKKIGRIPGANSITMFKTYTQSMIHLFYGNLKSAMVGGGGDRMEAAKAAAGMVVANALFAGVYGAAAIEPLRLAVYAYHKLFDKEGEVFDLKNAIHRYLSEHLGKAGGDVAAGGLPHLAGFDLSGRMGLADLFFHEPPDLFSADKDAWKNFAFNEAGPMFSFLADRVSQFVGHMQKGEAFQAVSSAVPVKMYQDAVKAYELLNSGKKNSLGGQLTKPSALDAAYQLFGVKPSSVAAAQERTTTKINYNAEVKATRDSLIKTWTAAAVGEDRRAVQKRINDFNKLHPAEAIRGQDQLKMLKFRQRAEANSPTRDVTLNKMMDY
jgi:hypothetical protein